MSEHQVKYTQTKDGTAHFGRCRCGATSGQRSTTQDVQDWAFAHDQYIARVRAGLGTKTPSLKSQRNYYREQADDTSNTEKDRSQWKRLADELDKRLNDGEPTQEDVPLEWGD